MIFLEMYSKAHNRMILSLISLIRFMLNMSKIWQKMIITFIEFYDNKYYIISMEDNIWQKCLNQLKKN